MHFIRNWSLQSLAIVPLSKSVNQPFEILKQGAFSFSLWTYVLQATFHFFSSTIFSTLTFHPNSSLPPCTNPTTTPSYLPATLQFSPSVCGQGADPHRQNSLSSLLSAFLLGWARERGKHFQIKGVSVNWSRCNKVPHAERLKNNLISRNSKSRKQRYICW